MYSNGILMSVELQDLRGDLFDAVAWEGVAPGTCVLLQEHLGGMAFIVYAGPVRTCPEVKKHLVLLNIDDFTELQQHINKRKH